MKPFPKSLLHPLASLAIAVVAVGCTQYAAGGPNDSFSQATRSPYQRPPIKSINGKSIADMKKAVEEKWDSIVFEKDGQKVEYVATLKTGKGDIEIEFYPEDAPNHVRSFIALCEVGFFEDLLFHRCIPDFVIQGGCPLGTGTGGPGYCLKPEFNNRAHEPGILSMARAQPTDSAGSQFFICTGSPRFLDGKYTVFGKVTKGMDVVQEICNAPTGPGDRPVNPVKITSASVKTK